MFGNDGDDGYRPWKFHLTLLVVVGIGVLCYIVAKAPCGSSSNGGHGMPVWLMQHSFHH